MEENFFYLTNDYFLNEENIGDLIDVVLEYRQILKSSKYENCLITKILYKKNDIRPHSIEILFNNKVRKLNINRSKRVKIKHISKL